MRSRSGRRAAVLVWFLLTALLAAACGGRGDDDDIPIPAEAAATGTGAPSTAITEAEATATPAALLDVTVEAANSTEPSVTAGATFKIELGPEEPVEPAGADLLEYLPDGHISYITTDEELLLWITAATDTYLFTGNSLEELALYTEDDQPVSVLGPDGEGFDENYAGFGAVIPRPDLDDLLGLYHAEQCTSENFTATIGLARSTDEGYSWGKLGVVITGQALAPLCSVTTGAGELSATVTADGYIYLYYVDWSSGIEDGPPDQIYLARAPLNQAHQIDSWKKYAGGTFSAPGIGGMADPVIPVPEPVDSNAYAALPGVTWNTDLGRYIAVFETDIGFSYTSSEDGIVWETATKLMDFPQPQGARRQGDVWFSYPTMLSPSEPTHLTTSQSGYLYYSRGTWDGQPHRLVRRSFTIVAEDEVPG